MPTGYTAPIADNTPGFTFKKYLLTCARAFGALIDMRDDSLYAEIPDSIEPSKYHIENIERIDSEIELWRKLSPCEIKGKYEDYYKSQMDYYNKYLIESKELKERYAGMRKQAEAWVPPTSEHEGLKKFMIEQIDISVRDYVPDIPNRILPTDWFFSKIEMLKEDREYHVKEYDKEVKNCDEKTKWIQELKKSI